MKCINLISQWFYSTETGTADFAQARPATDSTPAPHASFTVFSIAGAWTGVILWKLCFRNGMKSCWEACNKYLDREGVFWACAKLLSFATCTDLAPFTCMSVYKCCFIGIPVYQCQNLTVGVSQTVFVLFQYVWHNIRDIKCLKTHF